MMNDKKSKLLFEDLYNVANKWTAGVSNRELKPRKLTLLDLLKGNQEENGQAPATLPHTMTPFVDELADIYAKCTDLQGQVAMTYNTNLVKDTKNTKKVLHEIVKLLESQKDAAKKIGMLLDKLQM
jgi:hypothetical protein